MANKSIHESIMASAVATFASPSPSAALLTATTAALPAINEALGGGGGGGKLGNSLPVNFTYNGEHFYIGSDATNGSGNFSGNLTAARHDIIFDPMIQLVFWILYIVIFVVGVFGNVLVCYVVVRNRAMQTVTNMFITNLALSDILLCFLAVPVTPSYTFLQRWIFGTVLCHVMAYAQGVSVYISSLTLTSIAIDRFFVIIYPFHPRMKLSTCAAIILGIWCFALLVTSPYGYYIKHFNDNQTLLGYCEESWPTEELRKLFGSITSTLQFVAPFVIISFCYCAVSIKLNDRARRKPGSKTSHKERLDRVRKKRTNRMLISMVAFFGLSWLPLNIVNILNDFYEWVNLWEYYNIVFFMAHAVAMSSTCYNPFLYAWLNENFRKEFKQVLPCFSRRQASVRSTNGTKWRTSERTGNGNNETMQESLLPSSCLRPNGTLAEIIPRGPTANEEDRIVFKQRLHTPSVDSILLSDVAPPMTIFGGGVGGGSEGGTVNGQTVMLPSGVLETPFDGSDLALHSGDNAKKFASKLI